MKTNIYLIILFITISFSLMAGEINESYTVSENGEVFIDNIAGIVNIKGWEKNEISIKGTYGIGIKKIEITSTPNKTKISVIPKIPPFPVTIRVNLEIYIPFNNSLNVNTINSKIYVSDLKNNVYLNSTSGDIDITGDQEELEVDTTSGKITINGSGKYMKVNSISGEIKINGEFLRIYSKTISGNIILTGDKIDFGEFSSTSGQIYLDCFPTLKANIVAETTSGEIKLTTDKNLNAKFNLQSFNGIIKLSGIKVDNNEKDTIQVKKKFRNLTSNSDIRIIFQTLSGNITISGK